MARSVPQISEKPRLTNDCGLLGQIFEHRLGVGACDEGGAAALSSSERAELIQRFVALLRQLSSLMRVSEQTGAKPSLNAVLLQMITIVTQALDADRSTLFLHDPETDELFSRVAQGDLTQEIRFSSGLGIAGKVFRTGEPLFITDAHNDTRFNPEIDEETGYHTRTVLCVPVRNWDNQIIGVTEVLNKRTGQFSQEDLAVLEALTSHAAAALESMQLYESIEKALHDEAQLLGITTALSSELQLDTLLVKIMAITTEVLDADRSTLLLYDDETGELRSKVAQGLGLDEIRIPARAGIAGSVFSTGQTVNIPDAYADQRFNPEVDRVTGYSTRSILCAPVITHSAETIGIIQALNKRGGPFKERDEKRLRALASQAAIAIENARLFESALNARNYSESILQSLSNGVITLDSQRKIIKTNPVACRILGMQGEVMRGMSWDRLFGTLNPWVREALDRVEQQQQPENAMDAELRTSVTDSVSVNLNVEPLIDFKRRPIGFILVLEDITEEKRVKSTMARYMSHEVAEKLLETSDSILGGKAQDVTILFSDIRNFTGMAENLGAQDTVAMLNDYFSEMAESVFRNGGILDKYIGDSIMALFGTPFAGPDDADNALETAVDMVRSLRRFNQRRTLAGEHPIDIRVGISSGEVIAGNIGSPRRMDYTVIGHTVNVASRVEGANSYYGSQILVTDATMELIRKPFTVRELDFVRVKGSQTPVAIYEVLDGRDNDEYPRAESLIDAFETGLHRYRERRWTDAVQSFREALKIWPGDRPSSLFLGRCELYQKQPPAEGWDGVWTMTAK
jgi:adenylate cyclase